MGGSIGISAANTLGTASDNVSARIKNASMYSIVGIFFLFSDILT
jgi:hypothetical protein